MTAALRSRFEPARGRVLTAIVLLCSVWNPSSAPADSAQTANFQVVAESSGVAGELALRAEELRSELARDWLGADLADWDQPCVVEVTLCPRLSGDTTYVLGQGSARHWRMLLRGPVERIAETLLPHEILHTVLASHYHQAVPRWADEGAALSVEAATDQERLWALEGPRLVTGECQSLAALFASDSYPVDRDELRAFYVQGAAVTQFLLHGGKSRFLEFVGLGMTNGWDHAVTVHYGFADVAGLEAAWKEWLQESRPAVVMEPGQLLSDAVGFAPGTQIIAAQRVTTVLIEVQGGQ